MKRAVLVAFVMMMLVPGLAQAVPGLPISPHAPVPAGADTPARWHRLGPIAFARTAHGDADLWVVRADGTRLERLTSSRKDDTQPAWMPTGARITFVRTGNGGRANLHTMHVWRGRPSLFLRNGTSPSWSPDGSRLAFARTVAGNTDVYTVAPDGTDLVRVTSDPGVDTDPTWGPGGTRLTFASDRDGDFDIYIATPDGAGARALTADAIDQRNPWDLWTWRDIGYDQGRADDAVWCWQTIGVPEPVPGPATSCAEPGEHSYAVGTYGPFVRLETGSNGIARLWAWAVGDDLRLTSGTMDDSDPAVRPATQGVVRRLTGAAGDIESGLAGAQAWVDANGTGIGADESPTGLVTVAPSLCLVHAAEASVASGATCDAGTGTGSTSIYADADEISLARDTGLGICLMATYKEFGGWRARFSIAGTPSDCTGMQARSAASNGY